MRKAGELLYRLIAGVSDGMAIGGVVFLLILVVVMIANIVGRRFLGAPIPMVPEFSGVVLLMVISLGWAYTLVIGKNVKVEVFTDRLRRGPKLVLDTITSIICGILVCFLIFFTAKMTITSYTSGSKSFEFAILPLWILQIFLPLGLIVMVLALVPYLRDLWTKNKDTKQGEAKE